MSNKIILIAIAVFLQSNIYSQKVKFKAEEIWTMGSDEKAAKEYLLAQPAEIAVDSKGNIYVHDYLAPEIRKYTADGKYVAKFGRFGEGPGEFRNLYNFCINKADELVAVDVHPQRITVFDTRTAKNKNILLNNILEPKYIGQLNALSYILTEGKEAIKNKKLFTLWSNDFRTRKEQFGDLTTLLDLNDKFQSMNSADWTVTVIDSVQVAAATNWYSQTSYLFRKENGNWSTIPLKGVKPNRRSYDFITDKEFINAIKNGDNKYGSVSGGGTIDNKVYIRLYHTSSGIFSYRNKYIVHFSKLNNFNGKRNLGADVFSLKGEYLGYYLIKELNDRFNSVKLACADNQGNCYFIEYSNKIPVIKKYKITIN
jgi:hypothetical protein